MNYIIHTEPYGNCLAHYGVKGMKWGVRRYRNEDGTLTPAGKKRHAKRLSKLEKKQKYLINKAKIRGSQALAIAEDSKKNADEIKKLGVKSKYYQTYFDSFTGDSKDALAYQWAKDHGLMSRYLAAKSINNATDNREPSFSSVPALLANVSSELYIDDLASKQFLKDNAEHFTKTYDRSIKLAEEYQKKSEKLMSMNVEELYKRNSYKAVKKQLKQAMK